MKADLLKDASRAGLFHLPEARRGDIENRVGKSKLLLLSADLEPYNDIHRVLGELGQAFGFPIWYGVNLDALHDCLTDPEWCPGKGLALLISGLDGLRKNDPEAFSTLVDVLRSAATTRSSTQPPLWILLTTPARGVSKLPDA